MAKSAAKKTTEQTAQKETKFLQDKDGKWYVEYKMKYPIKKGKTKIDVLQVYRPSLGMIEAADAKENEADKDKCLVYSSIRKTEDEVNEFDVYDYKRIKAQVTSFLLEADQEDPLVKETAEIMKTLAATNKALEELGKK